MGYLAPPAVQSMSISKRRSQVTASLIDIVVESATRRRVLFVVCKGTRKSAPEEAARIPVGAIILIGLGVIFLLDQFGWFRFDWFGRFWPLILIAVGVSVLMKRTRRGW